MRYFMLVPMACVALVMGSPSRAASVQAARDFNMLVVAAVQKLERERAGGGYNINKSYSRDLDYNTQAAIPKGPASRIISDHETMCVAAVIEVIVEAINAYADQQRKAAAQSASKESTINPSLAYQLLPASTWTQSNPMALRPYIFLQGRAQNILGRELGETPRQKGKDGNTIIAYARGTGQALAMFHVGEELGFDKLRPGDFVNFNREYIHNKKPKHSGHAVIFLNYINFDNTYTSTYNSKVIGFEYFSAQGMKKGTPDAGFARRDAYFGAYTGKSVSHPMDRHIILPKGDLSKPAAKLILNGGRMWVPEQWNVVGGLREIRDLIARNTRAPTPQQRAVAVTRALLDETAEPAVDLSGEEG